VPNKCKTNGTIFREFMVTDVMVDTASDVTLEVSDVMFVTSDTKCLTFIASRPFLLQIIIRRKLKQNNYF